MPGLFRSSRLTGRPEGKLEVPDLLRPVSVPTPRPLPPPPKVSLDPAPLIWNSDLRSERKQEKQPSADRETLTGNGSADSWNVPRHLLRLQNGVRWPDSLSSSAGISSTSWRGITTELRFCRFYFPPGRLVPSPARVPTVPGPCLSRPAGSSFISAFPGPNSESWCKRSGIHQPPKSDPVYGKTRSRVWIRGRTWTGSCFAQS